MRLSRGFLLVIFCAACVRSTSEPPGVTGGTASATGGTGGMRGDAVATDACPVLWFTQPGCSDDVQPQCLQNMGGASACGVCDCQGRLQAIWCTGSPTRFAYRTDVPYGPSLDAGNGAPCDPHADAR